MEVGNTVYGEAKVSAKLSFDYDTKIVSNCKSNLRKNTQTIYKLSIYIFNSKIQKRETFDFK